jgi:hypothetical protein
LSRSTVDNLFGNCQSTLVPAQDPILVLQILSQNFNKNKLNNIWWVI